MWSLALIIIEKGKTQTKKHNNEIIKTLTNDEVVKPLSCRGGF
jgi:hypothetical protein